MMRSMRVVLAKYRSELLLASLVAVMLASPIIDQSRHLAGVIAFLQLLLLIAGITMVAWMITKTAWIGFVGFQVVMTLAYLPTIESMWRWRPGRSPEPIEAWGLNAVAALIGVVLDVTGRHDYVAMLYPLRACLLCLMIVVLAVRWERKSRAALVRP